MSAEIYTKKEDLLNLIKILDENQIDGIVKLIYDNNSGIGSTLDVEFDFNLNGRLVTVRANITDESNW